MKKKIIIIGAGVAGLTLANILKNNSNYEYIVYEKNESLNLEEGYGIQLSVNSISILNKLGFDKFNSHEKFNPLKLDFFTNKSKKICDLNLAVFNNKNNHYTTLKRSLLIKFLKEELYSNSIKFGKQVVNVEKINKKTQITFKDDSIDDADYIIVADGVFSGTKSIIEKKQINSKYFGAVAVRAKININEISFINNNHISLLMGSNFHIVLYPVNQDKEMNLVCIIRKRLNIEEPIYKTLEKTVLRHNDKLANLFKVNLSSWPIYTSEKPIKSYHQNVFYIGDAFYSFPPTMAQGASQSIESADELFNLINEDTQNTEDKYFKNRIKRTNQIKVRSNFNYFIFHLSNPFFCFFRNLAIKILVKNRYFNENYLGKVFRK
jgi:salicylate hydroxylase